MIKRKKKKIFGGVLVFILIIVAMFLVYSSIKSPDVDGQIFSITPFEEKPLEDMVLLDFCSSEESCNTYLSQEGMPSNFLSEKGYIIYCQNGNCYFKKI